MIPQTTTSDAKLIMTPDGRRLAWYEHGDPEGVPCIYTTGTPASGIVGAIYHEAALAAGVRWISPDKPGYGLSDNLPNRTLKDWAADVELIANHLGIDTFVAAGESGGGPHVLALGRYLPHRVRTAIMLAGMGPGEDVTTSQGMKKSNQQLFTMGHKAPWVMHGMLGVMGFMLTRPQLRDRFMAKMMKEAPAPDLELYNSRPEIMPIMLEGSALAFKDGPAGAYHEMRMFIRPWGFDVSEVTVPVVLWQGTEDVNVPLPIAQKMIAQLPNCTAHIVEGQGHGVALHVMDDIMKAVVTAPPVGA